MSTVASKYFVKIFYTISQISVTCKVYKSSRASTPSYFSNITLNHSVDYSKIASKVFNVNIKMSEFVSCFIVSTINCPNSKSEIIDYWWDDSLTYEIKPEIAQNASTLTSISLHLAARATFPKIPDFTTVSSSLAPLHSKFEMIHNTHFLSSQSPYTKYVLSNSIILRC
jgi:hypothetical protein